MSAVLYKPTLFDSEIEVIVTPHEPFHAELYQAHHNGSQLCHGVPEVLLDLIPYIAARRLLDWGYDLEAMLIVKLHGSDAIMIRAPFGACRNPATEHRQPYQASKLQRVAGVHRRDYIMSGDDRRMAAARRVLEAQKTFPQFYNEDKSESWVSQPMLQAMRESEAAFSNDDYDRAERLADVVKVMARRDMMRYRANPQKWIEKQREASAMPHVFSPVR